MSTVENVKTPEQAATRLNARAFFMRGGILSRAHPNYEYRPGQLEMAQAVESAIAEGRHLLVEAGTGTGKTLAYLVPSILSGKRVVISTGTKNLQEQLYFKDLPFLNSLFARPLSVCYMKGRSNYICRQKVYDAERDPVLSGLDEINDFRMIREWEQVTEVGDRSELCGLPDNNSTWFKLDARTDLCAGQKCKQFERCFITAMHQRALESDIIVVNHHLFFADLTMREQAFGSVIPDYSAVIFDEAHEIEDIAGQYFGMSVSNTQVHELIKDTAATSRAKLFATPELDRVLIQLGDRCEKFFSLLPQEGRQGFSEQERFLEQHCEEYGELQLALEALRARLELAQGAMEHTLALVRRANLIQHGLRFWMEDHDLKNVYWTERRGRGLYLQATPIDVSQALATHLIDRVGSVVLTSATLTVSGSFDYTRTRLGLAEARTVRVESQYDYAKQAVLYVPQRLPDPRQPEFTEQAAREIERILKASRGRAFVLFTSYHQMRQIYQLVAPGLEHPSMMQGDAPRTALLESFRQTPGAVLFGTSSFWQGVDVQGEQLSCVIIDRLPFAVPSDPVVAARIKAVQQNGGSAFYEYQIPQAVLALKQGFGRLIRCTGDRGILALLDNRITKLQYGRVFFDSLPAYRFTTNFEDVREFFHV